MFLSHSKHKTVSYNYLPLAPLLVLSLFVIAKAIFLTSTLFQWQPIIVFFRIIQNDVQVVGLVLCLSSLHVFVRRRGLSLMLRLSAVAVTIWCFVDVATIIALNSRVRLVEFLQYATQVVYTEEGTLLLGSVLFLVVFLLITRIGRFYPLNPGKYLLGSILLFCVPQNYEYVYLEDFASPLKFKRENLIGSVAPKYTPKQQERYLVSPDFNEDIFSLEGSPDVILVIVESLSAADSKRTSGINDFLEEFDRISLDGLLYKNMVANYQNTEGGLIALFAGYPPLQFPGCDWDLYSDFSSANHLLFREGNSYRKVFIVPSDSAFRGEGNFLEKVGFDVVLDQQNVPFFQKGPFFAFKSRPDRVLYDFALGYLDKHQITEVPLFLVLETNSSHKPYIDPLGRANTVENIWSYVDTQLGRFYDLLIERDFFSNGILIITSDHRKFDPLSVKEMADYGDTAKYRIPLLIVGKNVPAGKVNHRLWQQSDLLRIFKRAFQSETPLSEYAFLIDFYRKPLFGDRSAVVQIVSQRDDMSLTACPVRYFGSRILDKDDREVDAAAIQLFHRNNAMLQYCHQAGKSRCPLP